MYAIAAANGTQIFDVSSLDIHLAALTITASSYPTAGTITIETQLVGSVIWVAVATSAPMTNDVSRQIEGDIAKVRLTISGIVGGQGLSLHLHENTGFPFYAFEGLRALTVQNYTEANSKRGTQFEASFYVAALAPGASADVIFATGAVPVALKALTLDTDASDLVINSYKNPVYTGGTPQNVYNMSDINPAATTVTLKAAPTVSNVGTQFVATINIVGNDPTASGEGAKHSAVFTSVGAERILARNREYLRRITNTGDTAAKVAVYATWYEGELDLPID